MKINLLPKKKTIWRAANKGLHIFATIALIFNMSLLGVFINPQVADALTLQYKIEGQRKDASFTTGNICSGGGDCYTEGENVPFKLTINGLVSGDPYTVIVQHDYLDSTGLVGYDNFNTPGTWNGTASSVTLTNATTSAGLPNDITYDLNFTADATDVELQWYGLLGQDASDWNGAQLHVRLVEGVEQESIGNKEVPIQVIKILKLPSLTIEKEVISGDATADQFSFNVSPAINGQSIFNIASGDSSVFIDNISPDGNYTVTENGPANYQFVSGSGTNCTFVSDTATATVAAGKPATDATCTFSNDLTEGTLTVNKVLIPSNDPGLFNLKIDGVTAGTGANVGNGGTTGAQTVSTGSHTVAETAGNNTSLSNYTSVISGECDSQGNVTVGAGDNKVCTITNTRNTGDIKVNKKVDADGNGSFEGSNTEANNLGFVWGLDAEIPGRVMGSSETVVTGTYDVTENDGSVPNYHFVGWYTNGSNFSCEKPEFTSLPANISVSKDTTTEITLCNARDTGDLKIIKQDENQQRQPGVEFDIDGTTYFTDGSGEIFVQNVLTGDHTATETEPASYSFTSVTGLNCTNSNPSTATVVKDTTTTCTFTNTRNTAKVYFDKVVVGGGPGVDGDWEFKINNRGSFYDGDYVVLPTNSGPYDVTENSQYDSLYTLTDARGICSLVRGQIVMNVGATDGRCIVENTRNTAKVYFDKVVVGGGPGVDGDWEFKINNSGTSDDADYVVLP
ncbi:hypothetical protein IID19_05360, partial [Patescibacteria group bacterium]|nr:hypothetical protein [Patescibacteria group bacterium]